METVTQTSKVLFSKILKKSVKCRSCFVIFFVNLDSTFTICKFCICSIFNTLNTVNETKRDNEDFFSVSLMLEKKL